MNDKAVKKVATDAAEVEFNRFTEEMDLNIDTATMDADDLSAFYKLKARIIRAIGNGSLIFNEGGEAIYTPQKKGSKYNEPLTFHERTGASLMAMDGKKKNHDVAKTYAVMADMCKVHPGVFAGLIGVDIKVCEALFQLLMD